ncbi:MAG: adenylate cyclase [Planctomycetes bacterium]|nr:adenylate cyclase [Planctomycetota bacterium]
MSAPLEIERVFLLARLPDLPAGAEAVRIEQGYLPDEGVAGVEGRIRRATDAAGRARCTHTVKRGLGLVRTEEERALAPEEFERLWPATAGRRLVKTRHKVREGALVWEVDAFEGLDLVLAEVELPSTDHAVTPPAWLAPHVVREVTEEAEYRNFAIARRLGRV